MKAITRYITVAIISICLLILIVYSEFFAVTQLICPFRMMIKTYPSSKAINRSSHDPHAAVRTTIIVEPAHTWIVNNMVAQYSSKVVVESANDWMLEAFVLYDFMNQRAKKVRQRIKFLVSIGKKRFLADASEVYAKESQIVDKRSARRYIWKLRARLSRIDRIHIEPDDVHRLVFLLTDFDEFQKIAQNSPDDIDRILVFHKPNVYDSRSARKPSIAHCVHQVRGMGEPSMASNLVTWLRFQKRFGIDRVRMYFKSDLEVGKLAVTAFEALDPTNKNFVEFVDYKFD